MPPGAERKAFAKLFPVFPFFFFLFYKQFNCTPNVILLRAGSGGVAGQSIKQFLQPAGPVSSQTFPVGNANKTHRTVPFVKQLNNTLS